MLKCTSTAKLSIRCTSVLKIKAIAKKCEESGNYLLWITWFDSFPILNKIKIKKTWQLFYLTYIRRVG